MHNDPHFLELKTHLNDIERAFGRRQVDQKDAELPRQTGKLVVSVCIAVIASALISTSGVI